MEWIVNSTQNYYFLYCIITKHYEHDTHGLMWFHRWRNILVKQKFQLMPNTLIQPTWFVQGLVILQTTFFVASWGKMRCVPFDFFHFAICFKLIDVPICIHRKYNDIILLVFLIFFRIFKLGCCYLFRIIVIYCIYILWCNVRSTGRLLDIPISQLD